MKRPLIIYGIALALLLIVLKVLEYQYLVRTLKVEVYLTIIAVIFLLLGVWLTNKINQNKVTKRLSESADLPEIEHNLSDRELIVLQHMAEGLSNQEIADQLFISIHTVKTHSSNLYSKLDVRSRTKAILRAREIGLVD